MSNKIFEGGLRKDGNKWYLKIIPSDEFNLSSSAKITAVCGILKTDDNKFVGVLNKRGWDIPGGHVEEGETYEQTLIREIKEEANVSIKDIKFLLALETDYFEDSKTYILIYRCRVEKINSFIPNDEIYQREFFTKDDLMDKYGGGNKEMFKAIFEVYETKI